MPICIAGMHRSGTSLLARLLNLAGLYLAETDLLPASPSNTEGHWENVRFLALNDAMLAKSAGPWDRVPSWDEGWHHAAALETFRSQASELVSSIGGREPWGWKDPRNSLTLPFWMEVVPDLKVLICLRHPLEVAASLHSRDGMPVAEGLRLWAAYYERLGQVPASQRLVVHYQSLLHDPKAELTRVLGFAGIGSSQEAIASVLSAAKPSLRHNAAPITDLLKPHIPPDVARAYITWCFEAGADALQWLHPSLRGGNAIGAGVLHADAIGLAVRRLVELDQINTDLRAHAELLDLAVRRAADQADILRLRLADAEERLSRRRSKGLTRLLHLGRAVLRRIKSVST